MTEKRIATTRQAADRMGFTRRDGQPNCRAFMAWAAANGLKPSHGAVHHLWWDMKAAEQALDKANGTQPESSGWKQRFLEAMKNGDDQGALSH